MAKRKTFSSVSEMVHEASGDDGFAAAYERRLAERRIIKDLMIKRATSGMSQKDIARSFGCTQSRISKLENMTDSDLTIGDLAKYSRALGLELRITLAPKDSTPAARNRSIAFEVCADGEQPSNPPRTRASTH
jgi:predicted XRE-type DNA-binding protein